MKLNLKILIPIVILIVFSWGFNIYFFYQYSMDKPLLLNTYSAYPISDNTTFELYFVDNSYANYKVYQVSFPEINSDRFYMPVDKMTSIKNSSFTIYKAVINLNTVFIDNGRKRLVDTINKEPVILTKIRLINNDNDAYEYDVGKLCFYKEEQIQNNSLEYVSGMSSSNQTGSYNVKAVSDLKITEIDSPLMDELTELYDIKINNDSLKEFKLPAVLKTEGQIGISYELKENPGITQKLFSNSYIPLIISGKDSKGKSCRMPFIMHGEGYYELTDRDVRKMLDERRR